MKNVIFNKQFLHFVHIESGLAFNDQRDVKILLTPVLPAVESCDFTVC